MEAIPVGTTSNTNVVICYLKGVADEKLVKKVRKRIDNINVEAMYEINLVNELVSDVRYSPFRAFSTTERPDKLASALVEGRVGLIAENSPMAMIIPTVFWQFFQSSEDYYEHFPLAALNRTLRMFAFFMVVGLTALYVAIVTFHQEMVPTQLILTMAAVREPVPFPTVLEALFLEIILEALRESLKKQMEAGKTRGEVVQGIEKELLAHFDEVAQGEDTHLWKSRGGQWHSELMVGMLSSIYNDKGEEFVVNVLNNGAVPGMPGDACVEIPCLIDKRGVRPLTVEKPDTDMLGLMQLVSAYENLTVEAAMEQNYNKALRALNLNPLVPSLEVAEAILNDYIEAHGDQIKLSR